MLLSKLPLAAELVAGGECHLPTLQQFETGRHHLRSSRSPLDDLNQPWAPEIAAKFNDFFDKLVAKIADADAKPRWKSFEKRAGETARPTS